MSQESIQGMQLSVVMPVYNERYLVAESLRRVLEAEVPEIAGSEVVLVDDGSTDGTAEILERLAKEIPDRVRLVRHPDNRGKGAALRTGIAAASGDLIVIHDADLEYDPRDFRRLVRPFFEDGADVVYGSRFMSSGRRRVLYYRHSLGNRVITWLSNLFTDLDLTDVETCYKMFRAPLLKSIPLRSDDFGFEVEVTAKIAKRKFRIFEVPISYLGRTYQEGKKIGWGDAAKALTTILKFWLIDDLFTDDEHGSRILHSLERTKRLNRWLAELIRPWAGSRVLELQAGLGDLTASLLPRDRYVATDSNPHHLHYLRNLAAGKPYLEIEELQLESATHPSQGDGTFDTVVCVNALEHVEDPLRVLQNLRRSLGPGGRLIAYVPQGPGLFCPLDEALGRRQRFDAGTLSANVAQAGFRIERTLQFNRAAVIGWWWNGKLLRRGTVSRWQRKIFDLALPVIRLIDGLLPWRGLGLILVARALDEEEAPQPDGGA